MEVKLFITALIEPNICPYSQTDQSRPWSHPISHKFLFNIIFPSTSSFPSDLCQTSLPTKTMYAILSSTQHPTRPAHLIFLDLATPINLVMCADQ